MTITHLYHSGILIETLNKQIFIDVISDIGAFIKPEKEKYFLVTHGHSDHFDPFIMSYQDSDVYYILSDEIRDHDHKNVTYVRPNHEYSVMGLEISTFDSTDSGVAFLIQVEGKCFFHAGDLNWWHWEEDDESAQLEEENNYKRIVRGIPSITIDVAFIPCDPRLAAAYSWAIDYFLSAKEVIHMVPIHFRSHFEISEALVERYHNDSRIVSVSNPDQLILTL